MRKNEIQQAEWQQINKLFDLYWNEGKTLKSLAFEYGYTESALRYRLQKIRTKYIARKNHETSH